MDIHESILECIGNTPKRLAWAGSMASVFQVTTLFQRLRQTSCIYVADHEYLH